MTTRYLLTSHIHCQDDVTNMQYGTIQCRKLLCAYIEYFWQWMFNKYSTFGLMLLIITTSKASVSTRDCSLSYLDLAEAVTWTLRTRSCERSMSTNAQTYWCCTASYSTLHSRSTILCHSYSLVHSRSLHFSPLCSIFCSADMLCRGPCLITIVNQVWGSAGVMKGGLPKLLFGSISLYMWNIWAVDRGSALR